jgi:hypothetical protein
MGSPKERFVHNHEQLNYEDTNHISIHRSRDLKMLEDEIHLAVGSGKLTASDIVTQLREKHPETKILPRDIQSLMGRVRRGSLRIPPLPLD